MKNVKNLVKLKIEESAGHYLTDQDEGTLYDAYLTLKEEQKNGNGNDIAEKYVSIWQPLEHMNINQIVELIESGACGTDGNDAPEFIQGIDWSELRNQKRILLETINNDAVDPEHKEGLEGILALIDSLQDHAVDELKILEMQIYDFEAEEKREEETPEELFARENAQTIFEMRIEGEGLYEDDEMSKEFIQGIVDNEQHATAIKNKIRNNILEEVQDFPNDFERDADGKLTYDYTMYDYGYAIESYCRELYYASKSKKVWVCSVCGGQSIESHALVNPNAKTECIELVNLDDSSSNYCFDCRKKVSLTIKTIPYTGE